LNDWKSQPTNISATKSPPATTPYRRQIPYASATLYLEVLADGASPDQAIVARTNFAFPTYRFPDYEYDRVTKRITKFQEEFAFTGPLTIQTVYGPAASKRRPSLYGRGTTEEDKRDGNTTLGFHEHCHRLDYVDYLLSHPLPEVSIRTGITVRQYEKLQRDFERQLEEYMKSMADYSDQRTDEVGHKKSEFVSEMEQQAASGR
jgi:hypothetical protein